MISFNESILEDSVKMLSTRNRINRFDASTVDGALYSEVSCFGGTTILQIKVLKNDENYKAVIGLLLLVVEEIRKGYLAIGGQTAVGRGIFSENGEIQYSEIVDKQECLRALAMCKENI